MVGRREPLPIYRFTTQRSAAKFPLESVGLPTVSCLYEGPPIPSIPQKLVLFLRPKFISYH